MKEKQITIILSDLHLGGGKSDAGDDHVYQDSEFIRFLDDDIFGRNKGNIELFINGDFLEFAQVRPDIYKLGSSIYWCSEEESIEKLNYIINGQTV